MLQLISRLFAQWSAISLVCTAILLACHEINLAKESKPRIFVTSLAQNNVWAPVKEMNTAPKEEEIQSSAETFTDRKSKPTIQPSATAETLTDTSQVKAKPTIKPPATSTQSPTASTQTSKAFGFPKNTAKPKTNVDNNTKSAQAIDCPDTQAVQEHLYKGQWQDPHGISYWVDFVTRPMYDNDKVTTLNQLLFIDNQIVCQYDVNDSPDIRLLLRAAHTNGLQPYNGDWQDCKSIECGRHCIAKDSHCTFQKN